MRTLIRTNEGHARFLSLERISNLIGGCLTFAETFEYVRGHRIYDSHSGRPKIDRFDARLIEQFFLTSTPTMKQYVALILKFQEPNDSPRMAKG